MYRISALRRAPFPQGSTFTKSGASKLASLLSWYPVKGGEFLGNLLAGHNMFIQDVPQRFDQKHARHFSLVEALTLTPLFTQSMVHYFSLFCQYPTRAQLLMPMMTECAKKSTLQQDWLAVLQKNAPVEVVAWKLALMLSQLMLFPLWLMLSAAAPQLVHATLQHTNHILATKYECISGTAPAFVSANVAQCNKSEDFHRQQINMPTDFGVATVMLLVILYLTS